MKLIKSIGKGITKVNYYVARAASLLIFVVMLMLVYEVVVRFALRYLPITMYDPSIYIYDLSWMTYAAFGFLGAGYVLAQDMHVKADVFYSRMKSRGKMIVNMICYPALFFVSMGALLYATFTRARTSFISGESGMWTGWQVVMWPIRTMLFISVVLLTLQGIVKFAELMRRPEGGDRS